jgi:hypothetical protein
MSIEVATDAKAFEAYVEHFLAREESCLCRERRVTSGRGSWRA